MEIALVFIACLTVLLVAFVVGTALADAAEWAIRRLARIQWRRLWCEAFGHKFVIVGENLGIASAHDCTRCGHYSPAIDWEAIARPLGGVITSTKALSPESLRALVESTALPKPSRPAPPMPACMPPAQAVDNAALMCELKALREQIKRMHNESLTYACGGIIMNTSKQPVGSGGSQPTGSAANPNPPPHKS